MLDKKVIQFTRDGISEQNLATGESAQLTRSAEGKQLKYSNEQFVYDPTTHTQAVSRAGPTVINHANAHRFHEAVIDTSFSPGKKLPVPKAAVMQAAGIKSKRLKMKRSAVLTDTSPAYTSSASIESGINLSQSNGASQNVVMHSAAVKSAALKSAAAKRMNRFNATFTQSNQKFFYNMDSAGTFQPDQKLQTAAKAKALKARLLLQGLSAGTSSAANALQKGGDGNAGLDAAAGAIRTESSAQELVQSAAFSKQLKKRAARIAAMRKAKSSAAVTAKTGQAAAQETIKAAKSIFSLAKAAPQKLIIIPVAIILILILLVTTTTSGLLSSIFGQNTSSVPLPAAVQNYRPIVSVYAAQFGMTDYVDLILAVMAQESGGAGLDPMQAAEGAYNTKYPKQPNGITDPQYSIWCGIQELKSALSQAGCTSPYDMEHIKLALQGYNYGPGFISWASSHGGYSETNALQYSDMMAKQEGWSSYGDPQYVDHVLRYYAGIGGGLGYADVSFQNVKKVGESLLGTPYVLGGNSPGVAMDCSSFVCYVYTKAGKNMPRTTAQGIYDQYCTPVSPSEAKAGDLIFFKNTYDCGETITHVGIYCGNGVMLEEGGSHVQYANCSSSYWQSHFYAYGRVK